MNAARGVLLLAVTTDTSLKLFARQPGRWSEGGWRVHIVTSSASEGVMAWGRDVRLHPLRMERDPAPLRDLVALWHWLKLLGVVRPDVLVAGTPKAGFLGVLAAWIRRVPVRVYLLRGLRLEGSRGLARVILGLVERVTSALATEVIAISPSLRAEYVRLRLAPPEKVRVVGCGSSHGVDVERFTPADLQGARELARQLLGIPQDAPVVGFIGRVTGDKGIDVLLDAFERLDVSPEAHLLIIGGIEGPSGEAIADEIRSQGESRIHLLGRVPRPEDYYPAMDVLCLPSRREGFGNVVLEAALAEVPTIASAVTGLRDSVSDGVTGLLFPVGDPLRLCAELEQVLADTKLRVTLGRRARERAVTCFEEGAVADLYAAEFSRLLGEARGR